MTGKVCIDGKGYPYIYFNKVNLDVLGKGKEYTFMVLGEVDDKKAMKDRLSIIQKG